MKPLLLKILQGQLRHLLSMLGGWLTLKGVATSNIDWEFWAGVVLYLGAVIWSAVEHWAKARGIKLPSVDDYLTDPPASPPPPAA